MSSQKKYTFEKTVCPELVVENNSWEGGGRVRVTAKYSLFATYKITVTNLVEVINRCQKN